MSDRGNNADLSHTEIMRQIRVTVVDRLLLGVFIIAIVGTPISISRSLSSGWIPLYTTHLTLGVLAVVFFLVRDKVSYGIRLSAVIALFTAVGLIGLLQLGLLGVGIWWLVVTGLLMSVLYSGRWGILIAAATFLLVLVVAWCFVNGVLTIGIDANAYLTSWSSWFTLVIATSLMPLFVFPAIQFLHETTHDLLEEVARQRDEIQELATVDGLTGMLRPHALKDRFNTLLSIHRRTGCALGVMYIDLDGFKEVNDTHGHDAGDAVLQELSQRYRALFRTSDLIGRLGGDEFIFICAMTGDTDHRTDAADIARRLIAATSEPIAYQDQELAVGASVGISFYPDNGDDADQLITLADKAMYDVKRRGKNGFDFADTIEPPGEKVDINAMSLVR